MQFAVFVMKSCAGDGGDCTDDCWRLGRTGEGHDFGYNLYAQGPIMVPLGPEAWKQLRAPHTYICNIDLILVLFLLLPSLLRNVVYVSLKKLFLHNFLQNNASWNALYVECDLAYYI